MRVARLAILPPLAFLLTVIGAPSAGAVNNPVSSIPAGTCSLQADAGVTGFSIPAPNTQVLGDGGDAQFVWWRLWVYDSADPNAGWVDLWASGGNAGWAWR